MPYYRETLLSAWPSHMIHEVGAPPPKFDQQFVASMTKAEGIAYGRNPRGSAKRNQVENTRTPEKSTNTFKAPKFLSEKARDAAIVASIENETKEAVEAMGLLSLRKEIPNPYQNLEIKYSKYGVEDFDFGCV
jgi:PAB-dependent poly(A)-specific ribonuclease subunit 2